MFSYHFCNTQDNFLYIHDNNWLLDRICCGCHVLALTSNVTAFGHTLHVIELQTENSPECCFHNRSRSRCTQWPWSGRVRSRVKQTQCSYCIIHSVVSRFSVYIYTISGQPLEVADLALHASWGETDILGRSGTHARSMCCYATVKLCASLRAPTKTTFETALISVRRYGGSCLEQKRLVLFVCLDGCRPDSSKHAILTPDHFGSTWILQVGKNVVNNDQNYLLRLPPQLCCSSEFVSSVVM